MVSFRFSFQLATQIRCHVAYKVLVLECINMHEVLVFLYDHADKAACCDFYERLKPKGMHYRERVKSSKILI